jgi:hypothetical protein
MYPTVRGVERPEGDRTDGEVVFPFRGGVRLLRR